MTRIGYIMAISQYDRLEEDLQWMNDYGSICIVEASDDKERKSAEHVVRFFRHLASPSSSSLGKT